MATDVSLNHYGWPHEDPASRDDSQEISVPQMLDHGSISFGRYAIESLSWEKKSVFTVNRRQEELEKCNLHGLVAQKKAYFEEFFKNIRAAKSLKSNQQNQITLGSDVSTSCHPAEDEADVIMKHPGYGATRNYESHIEKTANGKDFGNVIDSGKAVLSDSKENIQVAQPKLQSSPTSSSRKNSQDATQETVSSHSVQTEHVGIKLTTDDALSKSRDIIDPRVTYRNDKEAISGNNTSFSVDDELVISNQRSATFTAHTIPQKFKSTLLDNAAKNEAPQKINQIKQETGSVPKVKKDHASQSKGTTKLDCRKKSTWKSSHGSNPVHMQVDKAVSSGRLLPVKRCKVTIPQPFSFATEKRATAPRVRGNATKPPSISSNRAAEPTRFEQNIKRPVSRLASSQPHAEDFTDVQGSLNKITTTTSVKGAKFEEKRCACSKERGDNILESSEARFRSLDLPCQKESGRHGKSGYKSENLGIKIKEKEALLSRRINLSIDPKKLPSANILPHDRRQEKPHWR